MSLPKRYTRKIVIDGSNYLWHLSQNSLEFKDTHITIVHADAPNQLLHVDPFPALLGSFEITPRSIRRMILWALKNGRQPTQKLPPLFVGYRDDEFCVLPAGARFTTDVKMADDK